MTPCHLLMIAALISLVAPGWTVAIGPADISPQTQNCIACHKTLSPAIPAMGLLEAFPCECRLLRMPSRQRGRSRCHGAPW